MHNGWASEFEREKDNAGKKKTKKYGWKNVQYDRFN